MRQGRIADDCGGGFRRLLCPECQQRRSDGDEGRLRAELPGHFICDLLYRGTHTDADSDADRHADTDRHGHADQYADEYGDADAHEYTDEYADEHGNPNADQ